MSSGVSTISSTELTVAAGAGALRSLTRTSRGGVTRSWPRRLRAGQRVQRAAWRHLRAVIDDLETLIVAAEQRGEVVTAPPRLVAYTVASLIAHLAHRRLTTDDGVSSAQAADFVVSLVIKRLRPDERWLAAGTWRYGRHRTITKS
jgi:hypothetical protein